MGSVHHHGLMGTRSRIGIELKDHSVVSVYCHWDGYPEGNGRTLVKHYQDREAVKAMIDGGSMSSCLLYTSPSPRDGLLSRMPSSA